MRRAALLVCLLGALYSPAAVGTRIGRAGAASTEKRARASVLQSTSERRGKSGLGLAVGEVAAGAEVPEGYNRMCRCKQCGANGQDRCGQINVAVSARPLHAYEINDIERFALLDVITMAEWTDDRLKNSPPGFYEEGEVGYPVWTPNLEIRNAKSPAEVTSSSCRVGEGGVVTLMKRVMVEVVADFNCFRYPFDKHKVNVTVASFAYGLEQVKLTAWTPAGYDDLPPPQNAIWDTYKFEISDEQGKSLISDDDCFVTGTMYIRRNWRMTALQILFPLVMIVLFSFTVFLIDRDDLGERVNIASIGFLTVMGYSYVVTDSLPRVASLLWVHWFLLVCFLFCFFTAVVVVWVHYYDSHHEASKSALDYAEKRMAIIFPATFSASMIGLTLMLILTHDEDIE